MSGGKTALEWRGFKHNIAFREVLTLWGNQRKPLPGWFQQRFKSRYQATQLFDSRLQPTFGLQPLPNSSVDILVSVPERALIVRA